MPFRFESRLLFVMTEPKSLLKDFISQLERMFSNINNGISEMAIYQLDIKTEERFIEKAFVDL